MAAAQRHDSEGVDVFNGCSVTANEDRRDPKVVALTLLARTLGAFGAAAMLIANDHVVEARTLARCAHENLFWVAALAKEGKAFVERGNSMMSPGEPLSLGKVAIVVGQTLSEGAPVEGVMFKNPRSDVERRIVSRGGPSLLKRGPGRSSSHSVSGQPHFSCLKRFGALGGPTVTVKRKVSSFSLRELPSASP